jgi:hypothetical protein
MRGRFFAHSGSFHRQNATVSGIILLAGALRAISPLPLFGPRLYFRTLDCSVTFESQPSGIQIPGLMLDGWLDSSTFISPKPTVQVTNELR